MTDAYLSPEMLTAGIEAFIEAERNEFDMYQKIAAVWMAMEAVRQLYELKKPRETVH